MTLFGFRAIVERNTRFRTSRYFKELYILFKRCTFLGKYDPGHRNRTRSSVQLICNGWPMPIFQTAAEMLQGFMISRMKNVRAIIYHASTRNATKQTGGDEPMLTWPGRLFFPHGSGRRIVIQLFPCFMEDIISLALAFNNLWRQEIERVAQPAVTPSPSHPSPTVGVNAE
ncbi:hypothetical protein BDZ97DRAFT_1752592 [Flammula alnicola]|nr:hypothetical protein BDZ97DRAFT_1752592 [Flammula alnicola]